MRQGEREELRVVYELPYGVRYEGVLADRETSDRFLEAARSCRLVGGHRPVYRIRVVWKAPPKPVVVGVDRSTGADHSAECVMTGGEIVSISMSDGEGPTSDHAAMAAAYAMAAPPKRPDGAVIYPACDDADDAVAFAPEPKPRRDLWVSYVCGGSGKFYDIMDGSELVEGGYAYRSSAEDRVKELLAE